MGPIARLVKNAQVPIPPPMPPINPSTTADTDQFCALAKVKTVAMTTATTWLRKLTSSGVMRRDARPPKKSENP